MSSSERSSLEWSGEADLDRVQFCLLSLQGASSRDEEDQWLGQDFLVLEPELASQEWEELQEQLEELHSLAQSLTQHVQASTCPPLTPTPRSHHLL